MEYYGNPHTYTGTVTMEYTDPYQWIRMLVWPFTVGATAMLACCVLIHFLTGTIIRYHATVSASIAILAVAATMAIASEWNGSTGDWFAFTIGLVFMTAVLIATCVYIFLRTGHETH